MFLVGLAFGLNNGAWAENKACTLATPAELKSALGLKIPTLQEQKSGSDDESICTGHTSGGVTVILRLAKRSNAIGETEATGAKVAKNLGFEVETKTFGPVTCSTMKPGPRIASYGLNTTCSVLKNGQVAAIEVIAVNPRDTVSIDKLRPLAEKMGERF